MSGLEGVEASSPIRSIAVCSGVLSAACRSVGRSFTRRGPTCFTPSRPDAVTRELVRLQTAGLDGLAINFVDYLKELPYFATEVLPRLEKLGLRTAERDSRGFFGRTEVQE